MAYNPFRLSFAIVRKCLKSSNIFNSLLIINLSFQTRFAKFNHLSVGEKSVKNR